MRTLSSVVLVLFGLACPAQESKPTGLDAYAGKDLRKLNERAAQEFRKQIEALTGDKPAKQELPSYKPWWVKPIAAGDAAWVFLEAYPGYDVPDVSAVQIHVFDKNWKRLAKRTCSPNANMRRVDRQPQLEECS